MADKCLICGKDIVSVQRLYTTSRLNKITLCREHDRELFLSGEIKFNNKYNLGSTKREYIKDTIQGFGSAGGF